MPATTLAVNLLMNASQYKREAAQAATATGNIAKSQGAAATATDKLGKRMSGLATTAKVFVAGAAAAAVGDFVSSSIDAAVDLQESINAVNVVFGESADGILRLGDNAADSLGLANSEFNAFAVRFSNFGKTIAAGTGDDVVQVVDTLTTRIADFASVMNLDVPEAAEKFQSGLAGQVRPLREFGIDVSAAATTQKALEMGLARTSGELSEQDKVLARYQLIMDQTANTAGDFARTQDDVANSMRTMTANIEDAKAAIGEQLLPVVANSVGNMRNLVEVISDPDLNLGWTQRLSAAIQAGTGESADAVRSYIELKEASNDLAEGQGAIIDAFGETREPLSQFVEGTEGLVAAFGNSRDALHNMGGEVDDFLLLVHDLDEGHQAAARSAELHARETQRLHDVFLGMGDPIRDFWRNLRDLEDAQDDVAEAEDEFGVGSREYSEAVVARSQANDDLKQSYLDLIREGIDPTSSAAQAMFRDQGFDQDTINDIMAGYEELRRQFQSRALALHIPLSIPTITGPIFGSSGSVIGWKTGPSAFVAHSGGVVPGTGEVPAVLMGGETVLPTHDPNFNRQLDKMAGGTKTVINVGNVYGWDDFVRKVRDAGVEIQRT